MGKRERPASRTGLQHHGAKNGLGESPSSRLAAAASGAPAATAPVVSDSGEPRRGRKTKKRMKPPAVKDLRQVSSANQPDSAINAGPPRAKMLTASDERRIAALGIRKLEGEHIELFTDLPAAPNVDELPAVFDLAVEPWCEYFGVGAESVKDWKVRGYLMDRRELFKTAGLLPDSLPQFLHGYSQDGELWLNEQPSDYYRRHLLLHEGTHAFMQAYLGGMGPPWYSEGMAELMGTHRWQDGTLRLRYFPRSRDEVPYWGRIKIVKTEYEAGRGLSIDQITDYGPRAHLKIEPYGWCWAITAFLDGHPQFADRFRQLSHCVTENPGEFNQLFHSLFQSDRRQLIEQWRLFVADLEYGYDVPREAISYEPSEADNGTVHHRTVRIVRVRADRGWQSTGIVVSPGTTYVLEATGRYQVAHEPKTWWCEPNGVTIRYHQGHPMGMLLAGVSDQAAPLTDSTPLARPKPVGLKRELTFERRGTLFLRVNDSPAELADNAGALRVKVSY